MYSKGLIKNQELGKPFPTSLQSLYAYRISVFSKASELARYPVMWDMSTGNLKMNALFLPPNLLLLFYSVSELQVGLPTSLLIKFVIPFGNLKQVRPRFSTWKSLVSLHFPNKTKRRPSSSLPTALLQKTTCAFQNLPLATYPLNSSVWVYSSQHFPKLANSPSFRDQAQTDSMAP